MPQPFCNLACVEHYCKEHGLEADKVLALERSKVISAIELERQTKVITMIHRREKGRDGEYITVEDAEEVLHQVRSAGSDKAIDFLLHCPGGFILPAEHIAIALKDRRAKVTAIVPHYAMSGATLITLAAHEILMDEHSILGPLDPQIQGIPAPTLIKVAKSKPLQYVGDNTLVAADVAEKALKQMERFVTLLLGKRMEEEKAMKIAHFLTGGYLTHATPITAGYAQNLGLPTRVGIPEKFYSLLRLYKPPGHASSLYSVPCPCFPAK